MMFVYDELLSFLFCHKEHVDCSYRLLREGEGIRTLQTVAPFTKLCNSYLVLFTIEFEQTKADSITT